MAIDKNSKAYQGLLNKGYTDAQIMQMYGEVSSGKNAKDVVASMNAQRANTNTSTPKTETITYNGQVSDGNKSGTANMNSMSQSSAINNSRNFQVGTGDVVDMPTKTTTGLNQQDSVAKLAKVWDGLDYETQQKKLNAIKGLKEGLAAKGITSKTQPTTTTTTTTTPKKTTQAQTPKQDQWDYQDNSQARMDEIARNLNGYRVTNPDLFKDPSAFYTFFIDGKGRSQDQIDYLWDYFNNVQKYGKYDNMTPDAIGNGLTNGSIPEDYLDYLKSIDPAKYQEVIAARQNSQDTIKYEDYLNSTAALAGMEGYVSEPSSIKYGKYNEIWMDEDNNGVDDRRENYATKEEQGYQKEIADINARNLDIDNTVKHTYDDYVKKYPGATKATLMAMAQDTNADLLREKENNLVELTRLQGYVKYMQEERFEMNEAGADSIKQLQDNLKMYYQYSPEGMAELAQAQYAATNITLDQADSGNETQKQMALQNVLDGYYNKYGDIIQRSEQQVINDVIAYAKKNGVGLAQALQENFVKPLQAKPGFAQLNATTSDAISWQKIGEDADGNAIYGFVDTYNKTVTPYGNAVSSGTSSTYDTSTRQGKANTINEIVSYDGTDDLGGVVSDIYNKFKGQNYGECGYLVNDYYKAITGDTNNLITGTFKDRKDLFTKNTPSVGDIVLFDWTNSPTASDKMKTYGHVALVEGMDSTGIWVVDANWDGNGTVDRRHINYTDPLYQDRVYGFYSIPEDKKKSDTLVNMGYIDTPEAIAAYEEFNKLGSKGLDTAAKQKRAKELFELLGTDENGFKRMADAYWDDQNAQQAEANIKMIDNLLANIDNLPDLRMRDRLGTPNSYGSWRGAADGSYGWSANLMKEFGMDKEELAAYNQWASDYDMLMANLMYDKYKEIKSTGGTFGSMSNAEWDNLKQAASNLKFNQDEETYRNNLLALKKQFQNLSKYGAGKQSTNSNLMGNSGYKTSTMDSLLGRFTSY